MIPRPSPRVRGTSRPDRPRRILPGVAPLLMVVLLAGCGDPSPAAAPPAPPPPVVPPTTAPPTTEPSTPSTTAEPAPADPPTTAADGTNYPVCATRPCEVSVSGATRIPLPGGQLRVTGVSSRGLTFTATVNGSQTDGTLTGCGSVIEVGGSGTSLTGCRDDRKLTPLAPPPGIVDIQGANKIGNRFILRIAGG